MKFKQLTKFLPLLGIALFVWILSGIDLGKLWDTLRGANVAIFIFAVLFGFFVMFIKAIKWKLIINSAKLQFSLLESFTSWLIGFGVGMLTPGRVGDFYRAVHLKRRNPKQSTGRAIATVFFDRIVDIVIMMIFAAFGVLYLVIRFDVDKRLQYTVIGAIVVGVIGIAFFRENFVAMFLRPLFRMFIPDKHKEKIRDNFKRFFALFREVIKDKPQVLKVFLIGIVGWLLAFFQTFLFAVALGIDVSYTFIAAITPIINMVEIIPISFSGMGTRDAVLIYFFSLLAIASESAVAFSFLILAFIYIAALIGLIMWYFDPVRKSKSAKKMM